MMTWRTRNLDKRNDLVNNAGIKLAKYPHDEVPRNVVATGYCSTQMLTRKEKGIICKQGGNGRLVALHRRSLGNSGGTQLLWIKAATES